MREAGIKFVDTAALYSVSATSKNQGSTERIIGSWLKNRKHREDVVIASKIMDSRDFVKHIKTGDL